MKQENVLEKLVRSKETFTTFWKADASSHSRREKTLTRLRKQNRRC